MVENPIELDVVEVYCRRNVKKKPLHQYVDELLEALETE